MSGEECYRLQLPCLPCMCIPACPSPSQHVGSAVPAQGQGDAALHPVSCPASILLNFLCVTAAVCPPRPGHCADVAAGVGRVSERVLLPLFQEVDVMEPSGGVKSRHLCVSVCLCGWVWGVWG